MKLFYKPGACSLASHICLRESGLDFTLVGVDLAKKRTENDDDYLQINPKGQVPALLLDDNTLLTEGVAIMQYIADTVADRQLLALPAASAAIKRWSGSTSLPPSCTKVSLRCSVRIRRKSTSRRYARYWTKNSATLTASWQTTLSGCAARALPSPMPICLPCCAGRMR